MPNTRVHSASPNLSSSLSTGASPTTGTTATPTASTFGPVPIPSFEAVNEEISWPSSPTVPTSPTPPSVPMPASDGTPIFPSMGVSAAQVAMPQPLLPSQIMALGSVSEAMEMIMPINSRPVSPVKTMSSPVVAPAAINPPIDTAHSWLVERLSSPITGKFSAEFAEEVEAELNFVSSRPNSLDGKADVQYEAHLRDRRSLSLKASGG